MRLAGFILALCTAATAGSEVRVEAPHHRQVSKGCGAASLSIVLGYWAQGRSSGDGSPQDLYNKLYSPELEGIRLADMKAYLSDNGFHAFTMRAGWEELEEQLDKRRPVIVTLQEGRRMHYTVVTGVGPKRVWLNDPAKRKPRKMSRERFERKWAAAEGWMLLAIPR